MKYLLFFLILSFCSPADAKLDLIYDTTNRPARHSTYQITGLNPSDSPQIVIIKIADKKNAPYHDRVNEERWVLPGPFTLWVQPAALQTPKGRFLKLDSLVRTTVFSPARLEFTDMREKEAPPPFPYAFDFGPPDSPIFSGFRGVDPTSPLFTQGTPKAFIRKGVDSLIRDGIKGVTKFETPLPNGNWMVHLWTEDVGEWETLPPLYERRIRANGKDISVTKQDHATWVSRRYLQGSRDRADHPWAAFGARRGGLIQAPLTVTNGHLTLEFAGANAQATTLSALLLEPMGDQQFVQIQAARKNWFELRWPYLNAPSPSLAPNVRAPAETVIAFAGETLFVPLTQRHLNPHHAISARRYAVTPAFHRITPNAGLLVKSQRRLSPDLAGARDEMVQLTIARGAKAGTYDLGAIRLQVINAPKPVLQKSVGLYLEAPPHLNTAQDINRQVWCDLDYLKQLGLTAVAPPFSEDIQADYQRAAAFGFRDLLAYTPMKRTHAAVKATLQAGGAKDLIFSIADEPSNPAQAQKIKILSDFLQNASPFAKRAGHLNNPKDVKYLSYLDVVLANSGFGVDQPVISSLQKQGKSAWFYNMENVRLASGFYLWRVGAEGYLQWHARMPTADPYDPTDGREDDVQLLYPSKTVCSNQFDIDIALTEMVNGLSDLRWLTWLDQQAKTHQNARSLKREIEQNIPTTWRETLALKPDHWDALRHKIQKLALTLQM